MIADVDLLILALLLFSWLFLLALGVAVDAMYLILSFFVGIFLALEIYTLTSSVVLASVFAAMALTLMFFLPAGS